MISSSTVLQCVYLGRQTSFVTCSLFFKKEMELSLIGLQNAGKTSLVNVLATGAFHEDMIPTVGFNMRKVTKGAVTIKLWDLGGQVRPPPSPSPSSSPVNKLWFLPDRAKIVDGKAKFLLPCPILQHVAGVRDRVHRFCKHCFSSAHDACQGLPTECEGLRPSPQTFSLFDGDTSVSHQYYGDGC